MAGLVPAHPDDMARACIPERDRRDKPGDDGELMLQIFQFAKAEEKWNTRPKSAEETSMHNNRPTHAFDRRLFLGAGTLALLGLSQNARAQGAVSTRGA